MSKKNRHMAKYPSMKNSDGNELMWVTLEFDKSAPKDQISGILKTIKQMGARCKFRADLDGTSFIEVLCDESQQKAIDTLVRSNSKFSIGEFNVRDIDTDQELLDKTVGGKRLHLPENSHELSISSAAMGMMRAFEDFPSLTRPDKLLEKASRLCSFMLSIDSDQTDDVKLFRGIFIPSYIIGYRVGAQQVIHMDAASRKHITSDLSALNSKGNGSLGIAMFEKIIKQRMQDTNATKVSELFQT